MIELITYTERPADIISIAAGTSYGKSDKGHGRVSNCFKAGHMSVFEHASVTFRVTGISRACSHQLVRHRLASFVQKSQRYTEVDTNTEWYVMPPSFSSGTSIYSGEYLKTEFEDVMHDYALDYNNALCNGIKPEDARYLLPEACKTELTCTMNVRELFHFLNLRTDKAAQWEIRGMAIELAEKLRNVNDQWRELMELWAYPF